MEDLVITQGSTVHTTTTYNFYLKHRTVTPGAPVTKYVDIPGRNGSIDLSEFLTGAPYFENDEIDVELVSISNSTWAKDMKDLIAFCHGKVCSFRFSNDIYSYTGRVSVDSAEQKDNSSFEVKLSMVVDSKV